MGELIMPDGSRIDTTAPSPAEERIINLLSGCVRLLDTLVALECGVLKRADLKRDILAAREAAQAAAEAALAEFEKQQAAAAAE